MKSWNAQKTTLAERLADGRRYASGKTIEVADLPNFLEAVIRPADRVCLEGDNQKQADVLAAALADVDPPRSTIFIWSSQVSCCPSISMYSRRASRAGSIIPTPVRRQPASPGCYSAAKLNWELFIHILELFARYFVDLTPNVALIAAVCADRDGNLYTGPNTEDTPTVVEATTFKSGIVVAQVAEIVDRLPASNSGRSGAFRRRGEKPFYVEPLFTRDPAAITEAQVLTAMLAIKGLYAPYGIRRLNHGIGFSTAAIELLLPTYGEKLGLKGSVCTHWALNPHPALIPAIESGWVEQIHSFGSEVGMDDYIRARSDIYFTGPDGSLRSNRAFCQVAGLYACDMFHRLHPADRPAWEFLHRDHLAHCWLRRGAKYGL